jgi:hypothetical protein
MYCLECSRCKQGQGIRSQANVLPKQKRIAIARQLSSGEKQRLQCLREARSNGRTFVI